ncbi:MAG: hypothetical protein GY777_23205 [Candidatus Brocadiaceae bacterium]|nr:hypothetical protein [Candidatus Brocadiaceae bacterium]
MNKVSIVGIDNTGKSSIVNSLKHIKGVETIHLTTFQNNGSYIAKYTGNIVCYLVKFGERHKLRILTGLSYLLHLVPYAFEQAAKTNCRVLVSDRDPIIDPLCYVHSYLPGIAGRVIKPVLEKSVKTFFDLPDSFIYLTTTPEHSAGRDIEKSQLHGKVEKISRVNKTLNKEMLLREEEGIPVKRIDTSEKSLEEVTIEIHDYINSICHSTSKEVSQPVSPLLDLVQTTN